MNTYQNGGAGIAAKRLHNSLVAEGINADILFKDGLYNCKNDFKAISWDEGLFEKICRELQRKFRWSLRELRKVRKKAMLEIFSSPISGFRVEKVVDLESYDIIHLHWVSDFIDFQTFFKKVDKPIFWTFHDMNPFMGGVHYMNDLNNNIDKIKKLESYFLKLKKAAISNKRIRVITPSAWLSEESQKNEAFKNMRHDVVYNTFEDDFFSIKDKQGLRSKYGIETDKLVFLFSSQSVTNKRKGMDLLIKALKNLKIDNYQIVIMGAKENLAEEIPNSFFTGHLSDKEEISDYFALADAYILPSREDNLPNVMIEALLCGTPVIGFRIGGVKEIVRHNENGILASELGWESLKDAIESFALNNVSEDRTTIRNKILAMVNSKTISRQIIKLYQEEIS